MHVYQNKKPHISAQTLKRTVTAENAAKHIVASIIRKWPDRETFSVSSSCFMSLWIEGTSA